MKILTALCLVLLFSLNSSANLPPNDLYKYDNMRGPSNVTEEQFNKITDAIIALWQPLAEKHGAKLVGIKNWNDSTVNAYAEQKGKVWSVQMFGGLARRKEVTPDGFAMVVCHELGHHFGGYPLYKKETWAAVEGESDYFATHVCSKVVFSKFNNWNNRFREGVPPVVKERCDAVYKTQPTQDMCYRTSAAGLSLATLLGAIGSTPVVPKFETPDMKKVSKTVEGHPAAQCRLDTYFAGAVCAAPFDLTLIPGKGAPNEKEAELVAAKMSCFGQTPTPSLGLRPNCWFKSVTSRF